MGGSTGTGCLGPGTGVTGGEFAGAEEGPVRFDKI